jgi:hypothetical protein
MRVVVAIAAMIASVTAVPKIAAADDPAPAPSGPPGQTAPTPPSEPQPEKPADEPKNDPAYGERPEYDTKDFPAPRGKDVVIVSYPERTKSNITMLATTAGASVVLGAVGLYFHLDARSASNEVSAKSYTSEPWSTDKADTFDRAHRSSVMAGVFYGIGGGLLLTTAIMYIATEPKAEKIVIHPHTSALVIPTRGGAMVGGAWRF